MGESLASETAALSIRSRRDGALDSALGALEKHATVPGDIERADTPDQHVTALRRLPAVPASYAPFPETLDARLTTALRTRGISQLYTHQADAIAHARRRPERRRHHADCVRQDALLQRADPQRDPAGSGQPRLVSFSHEGARAGPARRAAEALCETLGGGVAATRLVSFTLRRRHAARMPGEQFARARTWSLSDPDMVHAGILPHHPRWAKLFENLRFVVIDEPARLPGRVWQPPVQRPAPPPAGLPALRVEPGVPLLVGHDSESALNPAERLTGQAVRVSSPGERLWRRAAARSSSYFVNPPVVNHQLGIRRSYSR